MPSAEIFFVQIGPAKYDANVTQLTLGFKIDGEANYMNYRLTDASEKALTFVSMQLKKALTLSSGGLVPVNVEVNDKGYKDVYIDDGFRSGGAADSTGGF